MLYIVSSNLLNAVKIGMWRSNIESLYSRYITCYGKNIHIDYFLTNNARKLESKHMIILRNIKLLMNYLINIIILNMLILLNIMQMINLLIILLV